MEVVFIFYFAYGSNLDIKQMKKRCPDSTILGVGCLKGYRLDFTHYSLKWEGGAADVIPDSGKEVWGIVYEISQPDFVKLNSYEGENYDSFKDTIITDIPINDTSIKDVLVYKVINKKEFIPPKETYLNIIKEAAKKFKFPCSYRVYLDKIKTC